MNMPSLQPAAPRGGVFSGLPTISGLSQQGCNVWQWAKCAGTVAACAAACASGVGSASCISCMGGAYENCKDCV